MLTREGGRDYGRGEAADDSKFQIIRIDNMISTAISTDESIMLWMIQNFQKLVAVCSPASSAVVSIPKFQLDSVEGNKLTNWFRNHNQLRLQ